jgi:predicted dinucleotide-binding enzyme
MNKIAKVLISLTLIAAAPLSLACNYPAPPKDLPEGASASKEEMLAGVKMIAAYQEKMSTYLSCLEADEIVASQALADDDEDGKEKVKTMSNKKYNAAVDEQTGTVELFNAEIRAFKARSK